MGLVTKIIVRLKFFILGQNISETFYPSLKFFVRSLKTHVEIKRVMSGRDSCEDALVDDVYAYVTQNSYPIDALPRERGRLEKGRKGFL